MPELDINTAGVCVCVSVCMHGVKQPRFCLMADKYTEARGEDTLGMSSERLSSGCRLKAHIAQ